MSAQRTEITSLKRPPEGYSWTPEGREQPRSSLPVYRSLAGGGAVPWEESPDGARHDAEPTDALPTLTPGIDMLPGRCSRCGSRLLDKHEAVNGERRGMLSCTGCGRQLCWLAPRISVSPPPRVSSVTPERPAIHNLEPPRTMRPAFVAGFGRLAGCGPACGIRTGHDPISHERHGRDQAYAELAAARPEGIARTGLLVVDFDTFSVTVAGETVALSPLEWGVLSYCAARLGKLCPYYELVASVWDGATAEVESIEQGGSGPWHGLTTHLCRLRGKLGPAAPLLERMLSRGLMLRAEPPIGGAEP